MIMRDSINASNIPADTPVVGGYGDGGFEWTADEWLLFPNAIKLSIVVSALHIGDILDVEKGDATPSDVPAWVRNFSFARPSRRAASIYCNQDTWPDVISSLTAAGIDAAGPAVDWWIAAAPFNGVVTGGKMPVAIQARFLGTYDESDILDPTWVRRSGDMVYPGDPTQARYDVVYASIDGSAQWGAFPGGAGQETAGASYTNLGSPNGVSFVRAVGEYTLGPDSRWRANIHATATNGTRYLKVMHGDDFSMVADWIALSGPAEFVSSSASGYVKHRHGTDDGVPE